MLNKETGEITDAKKLLAMIDDEKLSEYNDLMGYYQIVSSELDMDDPGQSLTKLTVPKRKSTGR